MEEEIFDLDEAVAVVRDGGVLLECVDEIAITDVCTNSINLRVTTDRGDFFVTVWAPGEDME